MKVNSILLLSILATGFAQAKANETVLGKLGQTLEASKIYASASTKSRVYYTAKAYEYLILRTSKSSGWFSVVMRNGSLGYIKSSAVARLPYDVTAASNASAPTGGVGTPTSRSEIANYALKYQGTKYVWGGNNLTERIDCSGFVQQLYGKIGVSLPRTAAEQALVGTAIHNLEDLQPGDRLYFWEKKRNKIGHTGIYMGNGYFVHSSRGKNGVSTDVLNEKWRKILVAARR